MNEHDVTDFEGRVVVGTDGSEGSRYAAEWAARRAAAGGVGLTVVRVTHEHPVPHRFGAYRAASLGRDYAGHIWQRAQEKLDTVVAEVRAAHPDLDVVGRLVKAESVAGTLAEVSGQAEVLVIGRTGESAANRLLVGGSVAAVVQHAAGPVVVVPAGDRRWDGPVLVGVDEAESAAEVVAVATREARVLGTGLVAAHGWWFPEVGQGFPELDGVEAEYERMVAELTAGVESEGVEVTRVVRNNQPQHLLADLSADASLLVVGSRGRGGFAGLLLGSVSRSVISRSACPVMVVRT